MVNEIKNLRVKIDGLVQLTKELKPVKVIESKYLHNISRNIIADYVMDNSKEVKKAVDSLYLAKAWLGKILQELDVPTPYKNDGNRKTVEDIEPTADVSEDVFINFPNLSHVEKVDSLRQSIQEIIDGDYDFCDDDCDEYPNIDLERGFVYKYLCEARFWLGFELGRLREEK